jgi:hypothetical protein
MSLSVPYREAALTFYRAMCQVYGAQNMEISQGLEQAEWYLRANQKGQARAILREIIRHSPDCEEAWILSASVSDTDAQINYCLQQAIRINPNSVKAFKAIAERQQAQNPRVVDSEALQVQPTPPAVQTYFQPYIQQPIPPPINPHGIPPTYPAMSAVYSSPGRMSVHRYSTKWWLILLPILGLILHVLAIRYSYYSDRLDDWQASHYGNILPTDFYEGSEYFERYRAFEVSPEYKMIQIVSAGMLVCSFLLILIWLYRGIHGGINLAIKKLRGSGWVIILLFLPIVVFPAYLALMGIFGEFAYGWGKNALPAKKKCPYCKSWIPLDANRCKNCGQFIPATR